MKTISNLKFRMLLLTLFAAITMSMSAQSTVTGTVLDTAGDPIIGALQ